MVLWVLRDGGLADDLWLQRAASAAAQHERRSGAGGDQQSVRRRPDYEVVVYHRDGKKVAARTRTDENGMYSKELPAGSYVIITQNGIQTRETVKVTVRAGETVALDLRIDTGVR